MTQSVRFVCLGNTCRSPLAEAALRQECALSELSVIIDSAGTGDWHVEQPPGGARAGGRRPEWHGY